LTHGASAGKILTWGPFARTFTMSLANGTYGYLPTAAHHELGGYETWLGTSRVEVEAESKIVTALLEMIETLK
jgi:hypothetical protein